MNNSFGKKVQKIAIICVIFGIILFIIRANFYNNFLGSFLDGLWAYTLSLILYDPKKKIRMLYVFFLGFSFEFFQLICSKIDFLNNINFLNYYPGTYDLKDILSYGIGVFLAFLTIFLLKLIDKKNTYK